MKNVIDVAKILQKYKTIKVETKQKTLGNKQKNTVV